MKEVKLPFDLNPLMSTYHHLAHPIGIVSGNIPDQSVWFPWFAHKYINCSQKSSPRVGFNVYATDRFFIGDQIIEQIEIYLPASSFKKTLNITEQIFIEQIKKALSKGLYIQGNFNERYISSMLAYQKRDFAHEYLLYGFNDEANGFYAAGYTANDRYEEYLVPYSEYYASIFQPHFKTLPLRLMHFNKEKTFKTNYSVVVRDLKHYLESTAFKAEKDEGRTFGLSAWEKLVEDVSAAEQIDIRFTKIFMEHHKLMNMRLEYFAEQKIIDSELYQQYGQVKTTSNQAYMLSLKYNLTNNLISKNHCVELIRSIIETDKAILPRVVSQIENGINAI